MLTAVLFLLLASTALVASFASLALRETRASRVDLSAKQSYFLAEAGLEDVAWRIRNGKQYSVSETVALNGTSATVAVTTSGSTRTLTASGDVAAAVRRGEVTLQSGAGASFRYGVQAGEGGFRMENNTTVTGSVYANGDIVGKNGARISGDAFAAGLSVIDSMAIDGSARAHRIVASNRPRSEVGGTASSTTLIDDTAVGGSAWADAFDDSTIGANAYYVTSVSADTSVGGAKIQVPDAPPNLPPLPMPIPDEQLDAWEADAASGGTIAGPCPYEPADGVSLGPVEIACDLLIDGTKIITMTGTIWVRGSFDIKNSARLALAPGYGASSGVLIASNPADLTAGSKVTVQNSAELLGSGAPGSYLMAVSRNRSAELGGSAVAIDIKNSSNASIYYAPHGEVAVQNNTTLKELTAYRISIKNSAAVSYESGLADLTFSAGPSGGWEIRSWREVK